MLNPQQKCLGCGCTIGGDIFFCSEKCQKAAHKKYHEQAYQNAHNAHIARQIRKERG